jgi:uncharacterized protein (TIGR02444 family)
MIRPDTSLWAFSWSFYQYPQVETLCLQLQDQHGINVNQVLWALWLDNICQITDFTVWEQGVPKANQWHRGVVIPLRRLRRGLPKTGLWGVCRKRLLNWELLAEKRELMILERAALPALTANTGGVNETSKVFLAYVLRGLTDEQTRMTELFQQWSLATR